jgi:hypothetical protein
MLRHATPLSEKILAVLPTNKKNYEYVPCVPKYAKEKTIVISLCDEMGIILNTLDF